ncbi:MAG: FecR domain-containing protein [Lachnospiraceae bacterium]|nr:FecR domain-containing protein [Lachnospiraceae bacterium]
MKLKDFLGTTKGKVTVIGGAAVVAVGIGVAVLLQGSGYRSISVEALTGTVNVAGTHNNGAAYVGEQLEDGDDVTVTANSDLTMCMDGDKYVYADANTHFSLSADQSKDSSRIKINLDAGSELNELQNALGANDSYEVDTPNSTMAVRGTKFRVTVYTGDDGYKYTLLEVYEGTVFVRLKTETGNYNGVERDFTAGESGLIRGNDTLSEFVTVDKAELAEVSAAEEEVLLLHYESLPEDGVERLIELLKNGEIRTAGEEPAAGETAEETVGEADENSDDDEDKTAAADAADDGSGDGDPTEQTGASDDGDAAEDTADTTAAAPNAVTSKPAHVHTAGDWQVQTAATCQAEGTRVRVCSSCGAVISTEPIAKIDHIPGDWVTWQYPSCGVAGGKSRYCTMCGAALATEDIPALSHNWGAYGDDGTRQCSICGAVEGGGPVKDTGSESQPEGTHEHSGESTSAQATVYSDPCPQGGNHNWQNLPTASGFRCSKCGATKP